jgi:hypothetical protein
MSSPRGVRPGEPGSLAYANRERLRTLVRTLPAGTPLRGLVALELARVEYLCEQARRSR